MPSIIAVCRTFFAMLMIAFCLPVAVHAGTAPPAAGKLLRLRPKTGDIASYDCKFSARAEMKADTGEKSNYQLSGQTQCEVEVLGDTSGGDFGLKGVIQPYPVTTTVDGEQEEEEAPEVAARYVVNPQGRIKSISWLSGDPMLADEETGGLFLTPEEVFLVGGAAILPDKPVKKGDKWSGTVTIPDAGMGGDEVIKYESVLLGEEKFQGVVCDKIKTKATTSFSVSENAPDGSGKISVTAKVKGEITWLLDASRGMIVSTTATDQVVITFKITDEGGLLGKATIAGTSNYRSVLNTYNGVSVSAK